MSSNWYVKKPSEYTITPEDLTVWKSAVTGLTYSSREHMLAEEAKHAMRHGRTKEDELLDGLTAAQIRALDDKVRKAAERKVQDQADFETAQVLCRLHPEYQVCPTNAAAMVHHLTVNMGIVRPTIDDMEQAFQDLKAAGLLILNEDVLRQQAADGIERRAEQIRQQRASEPSEADLYESPLDSRPRYGWYR
jgi:hypothetical protein